MEFSHTSILIIGRLGVFPGKENVLIEQIVNQTRERSECSYHRSGLETRIRNDKTGSSLTFLSKIASYNCYRGLSPRIVLCNEGPLPRTVVENISVYISMDIASVYACSFDEEFNIIARKIKKDDEVEIEINKEEN